jgi:hypothetical protein
MGENSVPTPDRTGKRNRPVSAAVVRSTIGILLALAAVALVAGCNQSHPVNPISQSAFGSPSPTPSSAAKTATAPSKEST